MAIDPGYDRMGVAIMEHETVLFSDCLGSNAALEFPERLGELGAQVKKLIAKWRPNVLATENLFFEKNQKTAMRVAEVRGMLLYIASEAGLEVREYTPMEVKVAVAGYGKADKRQVMSMVPRLAKLAHVPKRDDEYDAIAIGLTCVARRLSP